MARGAEGTGKGSASRLEPHGAGGDPPASLLCLGSRGVAARLASRRAISDGENDCSKPRLLLAQEKQGLEGGQGETSEGPGCSDAPGSPRERQTKLQPNA